MPIYNKLVRDRIPTIIANDGKSCDTQILNETTYKLELHKKLHEELAEYLETDNDTDAIEELADLLELIHALTTIHNATPEQLEHIRAQKAEKRGGFNERIFLVEVHEH
ncbi:MAG: nucleoside triphosphate pyrophosphohydrolase, partial [Culicoidibacterales bacterium]